MAGEYHWNCHLSTQRQNAKISPFKIEAFHPLSAPPWLESNVSIPHYLPLPSNSILSWLTHHCRHAKTNHDARCLKLIRISHVGLFDLLTYIGICIWQLGLAQMAAAGPAALPHYCQIPLLASQQCVAFGSHIQIPTELLRLNMAAWLVKNMEAHCQMLAFFLHSCGFGQKLLINSLQHQSAGYNKWNAAILLMVDVVDLPKTFLIGFDKYINHWINLTWYQLRISKP